MHQLKQTRRERASEGAREHNCIKNRSNISKNRSNKTGTQLFGANTKSNENRNNKTETAHIFIRCNFGPLLFGLVFAPPSCIGVRTLHLSRHLASVFAPCIFLVCLSDGRTGSLFEFVCAIRTLISASSPCRVCRDQLTASPGQRTAGVSVGVLPKLSAQRGSIGYCM